MSSQSHMIEPEELMAYLDGELSPERALEAASHLEHCRECQKRADEFRQLSRSLMAWEVEKSEATAVPTDFPSTLNHRKAVKERRGLLHSLLHPQRWPKQAWGVAAMAVLAVLVFMLKPAQLPKRAESVRVRQMTDYYDKYSPGGGSEDAIRLATPDKSPPPPPPPPPSATTVGGLVGNAGTAGKLEAEDASNGNLEASTPSNGPMIVRTVDLALTARDFDQARSSLDEILKRHHGHIGELSVNTPSGSARSLTAALRIPADQLDSTLADLSRLGRVEKEAQNGEEVTQQYVDLEARLKNARNTESRLTELQRERRGKLSDVLAVEKEISRVRGDIEEMEAQRKTLRNQIDFATLNLTVAEDYKADLKVVPPSIGTQIRNAAIDGYRSVVDGLFGLLLWLLSWLPTLLIWALVLFYPARMAWKKLRPRLAQKTSEL